MSTQTLEERIEEIVRSQFVDGGHSRDGLPWSLIETQVKPLAALCREYAAEQVEKMMQCARKENATGTVDSGELEFWLEEESNHILAELRGEVTEGCQHVAEEGKVYTSNPQKYRCVKCGKFFTK